MGIRFAALLTCLAVLGALPRAAHAEWHKRTEAIMGTRIYVELWDTDAAHGEASIDAVMADMRRIDDLMSHYKPESQLSQINQHAADAPVVVDKELFDLIKLSTHYSEITEGAFDITYASVGYLYNYPQSHPPDRGADQSGAAGGELAQHEIRRRAPLRVLRAQGHAHRPRRHRQGLRRGPRHRNPAEARNPTRGGDGGWRQPDHRQAIAADGSEREWLVAIRHPDDPNKVVTRIPLSDAAMSTSGDYERYFDENGVRYHHIIDPRTGHSASKVRSATIIGPTATQTDGMSKTAFVLGAEKALEIINRMPEYDAVFVNPDGKVLYSNGLRPPAPRPEGAPPAPAPGAAQK